MPAPTYALAIDLDRDELFASGEARTGHVISESGLPGEVLFSYTRGHDVARVLSQPRAGSGVFLLDNKDGDYSIGTSLADGQQVRLRGAYGGTTSDLVRAFLDQPEQSAIGTGRAFVRCPLLGPLKRLAGKKVSTALHQNVTTGVAVGLLLDAANWPKNAQAYVTDLAPSGQWGLGEASGDALDLSGNGNDGSVTIGAGARDAAAQDDAGDGCIDFDGSATFVQVPDASAIQNIFDGGGSLWFLCRIDSDGEGDDGRIIEKGFTPDNGWSVSLANEAAGFVRLIFSQRFTGTNGQWQTGVVVPVAKSLAISIDYDADATTNDPTIRILDLTTEVLTTYTVGSGLTEASTPTLVRESDVARDLMFGDRSTGGRAFDGLIDEVAVWQGSQPTAAQFKAWCARVLDAPRHLDTGRTTLEWWWLDEEDAMGALNALKATEGPGAACYEDGTGAVVFKDRHARLTESRSTVVQATYNTAAAAAEPLASLPFEYDPGTRAVVNQATAEVKTRAAQTIQQIWALGSTVTLAPGESRSYLVRGGQTQDATTGQYIGPFTGAVTPDAGAGDYTVSAGSLASVTLDRTSGATATLTLTAGASGATVTGLRVRAQAVAVTSTTAVKSTIDVSTSQAAYGVRTFPLPIRAEVAVNTVQDLVNAIVGYQQDGRALASFTVKGIHHADRLTSALAREVSDRVRLIHAGSGLDAEMHIESITHRVLAPASHVTTFACEEADAASYFTLDESEMDGSDLVGF